MGACLRALAMTGALILATSGPALPAAATDLITVGIPLARAEVDQARLFCQGRIVQQQARGDSELTCDCFQLQWEKRTNRLHRLALSISLAPDSPQARSAVWIVGQAQDGLHEAKLEALSAEFRAAAQAALMSCSR